MFKVIGLLFFTILINSNVHAFMNGCAKDIFKVGASLDSAVYQAQRDSKELELVTDSGLGIYLNWIVYCPTSEWEISPYFYFRNYEFDKSEDFKDPDPEESFTVGVDFAKRVSLLGLEFDGIIGIASREDIILGSDNGEIRKMDINNTILTFGFKKQLNKLFGAHLGIKAQFGLLFPDEDSVDTGFTTRLSTDLHYKLAKKYALVFDLFFDHYDQELSDGNLDLKFSRRELGLGSFFLFRF